MRIKVIACTRNDWSYSSLIGQEFEVEKVHTQENDHDYYQLKGVPVYVRSTDCIMIEKFS